MRIRRLSCLRASGSGSCSSWSIRDWWSLRCDVVVLRVRWPAARAPIVVAWVARLPAIPVIVPIPIGILKAAPRPCATMVSPPVLVVAAVVVLIIGAPIIRAPVLSLPPPSPIRVVPIAEVFSRRRSTSRLTSAITPTLPAAASTPTRTGSAATAAALGDWFGGAVLGLVVAARHLLEPVVGYLVCTIHDAAQD